MTATRTAGFVHSLIALRVRPRDLDVLGHVNNAVILEYLEAGRWDWFERQGLVPDAEIAPVVARAEIDYLAQVPQAVIEVDTGMELLEPGTDESRLFTARLQQSIRVPGRQRTAVRAVVTLAFVEGRLAGRPVSLRDFLRTAARQPAAAAAGRD